MSVPLLNHFSPRRRKALIWAVCLLVLYTITGFLILPSIIRAVAVKRLARVLDRQVTIQKVKLNPFTFSVTVRGLLIKDRGGEPLLSWQEVYVNFQLVSLFSHAWVFKELSASEPFVRVQINKDY